MKANKKLILTESDVVRDLRAFISACDPKQLAAVFGYAYGMRVTVVTKSTSCLFECFPNKNKYTKHREKELVLCD